jgi:hypothetical protein
VSRRAAACYALACALPVAMAVFVGFSTTNVPIYDEWLWSPLILAGHAGLLQWNDLWAQQNSHRSVVPTLVVLALAALTGWDTRVEALVSVALAALTQLFVWRLFVRDRGVEGAAAPFLAAGLLLFSLAQVENWLWGFQLSWLMVNALVAAVVVALDHRAHAGLSVARVAIALACAAAASFTMLFGFAAWLAGFIMLRTARPRVLVAIGWGACACLCAVIYFHDYLRPPDEHGWFAQAAAPLIDLPQFVLAVLGAPLGLFGGRILSELFGMAACVAFAVGIVRARSRGIDVSHWSALFAFSVGVALLIAIGRTAYGVDAAVLSRYTTPASFAWIAVLAIAVAGGRMTRPAAVVGGVALALTNVVGLIVSWQIGGEERALRADLSHVDTVADAELRRAFTNNWRVDQPGFIRTQVHQLQRERLGPFRASGDIAPLPAPLPSLPAATTAVPIVVATAQPTILAVGFDRAGYAWGDLVRVAVVTTTNTGAVELTPFANLPVRLPFRLHETALGTFEGLLRIPFGPPGITLPPQRLVVNVRAMCANGAFATRTVVLPIAADTAKEKTRAIRPGLVRRTVSSGER